MKRIWIALAFIIFALSMGVFEYVYVKNTYEKCMDNIEKCYTYFSSNEYNKAYTECKYAEKTWNNSSKILSIFLVHSQLNDISKNIDELCDSAKNNDKKQFNTCYKTTKRQLLFVKKSELPDLENIL